jgi:hypothetical protein
MIFKTNRVLTLFFILVTLFSALAWALGASQEIRPVAQLTGIIVGPMEERKQALSSGDKIFVSLDRPRLVKKGDLLEIFQPTILPGHENKDFSFTRMGQAIILEIINERLLLCIIHTSTKEIAVGDRIYFPEN